MTAREHFDRWIATLQLLASPYGTNPTDTQREEMRDARTRMLDAYVAEVRRADADRLLRERAQHATRQIFCDGIEHAANRLTQWADEPTEEVTR